MTLIQLYAKSDLIKKNIRQVGSLYWCDNEFNAIHKLKRVSYHGNKFVGVDDPTIRIDFDRNLRKTMTVFIKRSDAKYYMVTRINELIQMHFEAQLKLARLKAQFEATYK